MFHCYPLHRLARIMAACFVVLALFACEEDEPYCDQFIGDWEDVEFFLNTQDLSNTIVLDVSMKNDGSMRLEFTIDDPNSGANGFLSFTGSWKCDEERESLEWEYDHRDDSYYGLIGYIITDDTKIEDYDVTFKDGKLELRGSVKGNQVVLVLEKS